MSNWSPDTLLLGSFDDTDCVTKESNGLWKAMQTTALRGLAHNFEMNWVDLITIHSILDIYSSKYMVSVIFQYYGTEFAHNYEQRWLN